GARGLRFEELAISGLFALELEPVHDSRGFFARTYSRTELAEHGIDFDVVQASVSFNERRGTLRGMHLQRPPHEEAKLVRCVAGCGLPRSRPDGRVRARPGRPAMTDDRADFEREKREAAARMAADEALAERALALNAAADRHDWSYQWSWLGLPVIQMPSDIVALQEVIWEARPQLVIETGIA